MYDQVVKVPLMVWDARQSAAPMVVDDLVSLMDVGPSVLEAAGIEMPTRLEGRSLMPYVRHEAIEPAQAVICEDNYLVMLRTREHKMVYYIGQEQGELYDLINDPNELDNRWDDPDWSTVKSRMKEQLLEHVLRSNYSTGGWKSDAERSIYSMRWHDKDHYLI